MRGGGAVHALQVKAGRAGERGDELEAGVVDDDGDGVLFQGDVVDAQVETIVEEIIVSLPIYRYRTQQKYYLILPWTFCEGMFLPLESNMMKGTRHRTFSYSGSVRSRQHMAGGSNELNVSILLTDLDRLIFLSFPDRGCFT